MEEVCVRFPHLGESIFNELNTKPLKIFKNVDTFWKNFIEDPNQKKLCIKLIKSYEKRKWSKLTGQNLSEFEKKLRSEKEVAKYDRLFKRPNNKYC